MLPFGDSRQAFPDNGGRRKPKKHLGCLIMYGRIKVYLMVMLNFIFPSIQNPLLLTKIFGFRPHYHSGRATVNTFGRGDVRKLAHCNGRMFRNPS